MKNQKICDNCHQLFEATRMQMHRLSQKHFYCGKLCRTAHQGSTQTGENNPNFGNNWSEEQSARASMLKKKQFAEDPGYAFKCGKANRGAKFPPERIASMHDHRTPESYQHFPSDYTKKLIGEKSKKKWTPEFKESFRKTMEKAGHWVPLDQLDPYRTYYKEANWIESMVEFFTEEEKRNLTAFGIFGQHNPTGWVRDHIVPRKCGYEMGIPVFILRHPANLQFISHGDNIRKGFVDRKLTINAKTAIIDTMIDKIKNYGKEWHEQSLCLSYLEKK